MPSLPQVYVTDFDAVGDGITDDTDAIQAAIEAVRSAGGGVVAFPDGNYKVSASSLPDIFDNDGVAFPASKCAIVQWANISLKGLGRRTARIFTDDNTLLIIAQIAPVNCAVERLEIHADWAVGKSGAGHGILSLGSTGGTDRSNRSNLYSDLYVHSVGSYGIGLQVGLPTRCRIENVDVYNTGADGLDLKGRSDTSLEPNGNVVSNVTIRNHGQRVTGSAGVDVRGVWQISKVSVTDFGGNAALNYTGVRFRTKPPVTDPYNKAAARSTLSEAYIRPTIGAAAQSISGVENGSDDVLIDQVITEDCTFGYNATGNTVGVAERATITSFIAISSRQYGFRIGANCADQIISGCHSRSSATAGIFNAGIRTKILCHNSLNETPITTSVSAEPTEIRAGSALGSEFGVTMTSIASGRVGMAAKGLSSDIDIELTPKGNGHPRFGKYAASTGSTVTGYVEIKDATGVIRKLAVIP